ncbi:MAG: glycosyltransferase [Bacteroidales bacterium]
MLRTQTAGPPGYAALGVVIPTRNSAATLESTLLSLASQRGVTISVIVADSQSTDGTLEICRRWGLRSVDVPPGNMYRAINAGMRLLATPWLTYLNSDDLAYADGYARLVALGEQRGLDIVYGHGEFLDARGHFVRRQASFGPALVRRQLAAGTMPFLQPAAIFRHQVYWHLGGFDERYTHIADYDFYARAAAARLEFGRVAGGPVAAFRVHGSQLSAAQKPVADAEKRRRRRQCGRYQWLARRGLSTIWKARNVLNSLAAVPVVTRRG